ncbi:MAG: alcohol dehydrogenase catalytic domain-containing protein, partial [Verrucomicrobia bacterium]|nr:alcohol dehydrogenase catalytic domain-containing protein [Verrucomicrobiota bacterium]
MKAVHENTNTDSMQAARLHGPGDLRVETPPRPNSPPSPGLALLKVLVTGICSSDLHSYRDARIGTTRIESPLIPGHEFSAIVQEAGEHTTDGHSRPLQPG